VARRLTSDGVLRALTDLFVERSPPDQIRSDNGGAFTAKIVRLWLSRIGVVRTLFIGRGSPWENGYDGPSMASCTTSCWAARSSPHSGPRC
jgi:transposase InsO family protein